MKWATVEAQRDATVRGIAGGLTVLLVAVLAGLAAGTAASIAFAAGLVIREVCASELHIRRKISSLEDHTAVARASGDLELPTMGGWSIEADFARLVLNEIDRGAHIIVECGAGASTLLIAACLRRSGSGRLYSIEHSREFIGAVRRRLVAAGLEDWVELCFAPLADVTLNGEATRWYALDHVPRPAPGSVNLLVVDGPPPVTPLARQPALDVYRSALAADATVLLDDGRRRSERRVALRWARSFPEMRLYWIDTVKGTWKLAVTPSREPPGRSRIRAVVRLIHPRPSGFDRESVRR